MVNDSIEKKLGVKKLKDMKDSEIYTEKLSSMKGTPKHKRIDYSNFKNKTEARIFKKLNVKNIIKFDDKYSAFTLSSVGVNDGVWTNSKMMIIDKEKTDEIYKVNKQIIYKNLTKEGETPENAIKEINKLQKEAKFPNYKSVIPKNSEIEKTEAVATGDFVENKDNSKLFYRSGDVSLAFKANQIATIKNMFPDAKMYFSGIDLGTPVVLKVGNEIKALLMPVSKNKYIDGKEAGVDSISNYEPMPETDAEKREARKLF